MTYDESITPEAKQQRAGALMVKLRSLEKLRFVVLERLYFALEIGNFRAKALILRLAIGFHRFKCHAETLCLRLRVLKLRIAASRLRRNLHRLRLASEGFQGSEKAGKSKETGEGSSAWPGPSTLSRLLRSLEGRK